jgi:hypothetical protein
MPARSLWMSEPMAPPWNVMSARGSSSATELWLAGPARGARLLAQAQWPAGADRDADPELEPSEADRVVS